MERERRASESQQLTELGRRVAAWRRRGGGGRGSRIPETLWNQAVRVARVEGLYATSRALRFNYERLRERSVQTSAPTVTKAKAVSPGFVALEMDGHGGGGKTVVDLFGRQGERMRLELASSVGVLDLVEKLWGGAP